MAEQEYQYRFRIETESDGAYTGPPLTEAKMAGDGYRGAKRAITEGGRGGAAELQRRPVGPWETVERTEIPPRPEPGATEERRE